jgi:hypothetical protein
MNLIIKKLQLQPWRGDGGIERARLGRHWHHADIDYFEYKTGNP